MNFMKKYYKNTTSFHCMHCNSNFHIGFWQWIWTMKFDITRHRYVKCPYCGERHWRQAIKVVE